MIFEIHFTFPREASSRVEQACKDISASVAKLQVKFSVIAGDPVMGPETYCYASAHARSMNNSLGIVSILETFFAGRGILPLRKKIEIVVYDTKTQEGIE